MLYKIIYFYVNLRKVELVPGNIRGVYITRAFKLVESNIRSFHLKLCDSLWIDLVMSLSLLMEWSVQLSKCNIAVSFHVSLSKNVKDWVDLEAIQKLVPLSRFILVAKVILCPPLFHQQINILSLILYLSSYFLITFIFIFWKSKIILFCTGVFINWYSWY